MTPLSIFYLALLLFTVTIIAVIVGGKLLIRHGENKLYELLDNIQGNFGTAKATPQKWQQITPDKLDTILTKVFTDMQPGEMRILDDATLHRELDKLRKKKGNKSIAELETDKEKAVQEENFKEAALLRDQIEKLKNPNKKMPK